MIISLTSDLNSCVLSLIPILAIEGNHDLIQESDTKRYSFELDCESDDAESDTG